MRPEEHARSVRARFSAGAPTYDVVSEPQRRAGERLLAEIPRLGPRRILEVGCGTGAFTRLLAERFPEAEVLAVDLSERMVEEARSRYGQPGRIRWLAADAVTADLPGGFDLVASNTALHWLRPLDAGMAGLAARLAPEGVVAGSLMLRGTLEELHAARLRAAPGKPPLASLPGREEVLDAFARAGLDVERSSVERYRLRAPSARDLLRALHLQGSTGGAFSRSETPLTRGEIDRLCRDYDARHRDGDGVTVTYLVGFFVARAQEAS